MCAKFRGSPFASVEITLISKEIVETVPSLQHARGIQGYRTSAGNLGVAT